MANLANLTACIPLVRVSETAEQNVGMAFAFTIGAGLCTTLGGCVAHWGEIEDKRFLTISLAISGGVMIYVSFIEIFVKSKDAFTEEFMNGGADEAQANAKATLVTTLLFFAGIVLTWAMDHFVHNYVDAQSAKRKASSGAAVNPAGLETSKALENWGDARDGAKALVGVEGGAQHAMVVCPCDARSASGTAKLSIADAPTLMARFDKDNDGGLNMRELRELIQEINQGLSTADGGAGAGQDALDEDAMLAMGAFTALSIFIHNFPEGLATFVATLADPSAGLALAVAIGLHNIPEGICVGVPVYYATKSRSKAFLISFLSGVSEPVGGLIGYIIMVAVSGGGDISPVAYGVMFGIVAGMMAFIVIAELLPTAHKHDPKDEYATVFFCLGMFAMATSLVAFLIPDF